MRAHDALEKRDALLLTLGVLWKVFDRRASGLKGDDLKNGNVLGINTDNIFLLPESLYGSLTCLFSSGSVCGILLSLKRLSQFRKRYQSRLSRTVRKQHLTRSLLHEHGKSSSMSAASVSASVSSSDDGTSAKQSRKSNE